MKGYKLQCVSKGIVGKENEYHVTWTASGVQYRSYVRVNAASNLQ